ncbi:hypothetical protein [Streptomyces sp. NPDC046985]|uniref:SCO0607 family lipoprotein n=1 Tax=Streptomyces sp. NPDC046985 TaxID=3155377 RepID=UPI0033DA408C
MRAPHFGAVRRGAAMAVAAALASVTLAACSGQDAVCGGGEYPVQAVGGTGSACVPKGQEPSKGYVRYPKGQVPETVGDHWYEYWNTHVIDGNGRVTKARSDQ